MRLRIISGDQAVARVCREVLADFPTVQCELNAAAPRAGALDAHLTLWDFHPGAEPPNETGWGHTHFVLLRRKDLASFCATYPDRQAGILLKPLARTALRAVIEQAVARFEADAHSEHEAVHVQADRDEMLQCLIQANLKLQEYDQDRTNFLARALHDFRAPLTALNGYCGLLLGEQLGPLTEDQKEVLQRMQHSGKRLSRLVATMFQLSIGRHIRTKPNLQRGDIREALDQALHETSRQAEEKHIAITVTLDDAPLPLYFEQPQMEQLMVNLLDNACKFTPKFGCIEVRGYPYFWERRAANLNAGNFRSDRRSAHSRGPNCYRMDFRDSGPGIPPEHLGHIFEEYTSYAGGGDRSGGGLGLAICRMILSQHNGQIWAENSPSGAVFSFVLPFHAQPAEAVSTRQPMYTTN